MAAEVIEISDTASLESISEENFNKVDDISDKVKIGGGSRVLDCFENISNSEVIGVIYVLKGITVANVAAESFAETCTRIQSAMRCKVFSEKDHDLVFLLFSAVQVLYSVFLSMDNLQKEENKHNIVRLLSFLENQHAHLFTPEHMKEIQVMIISIDVLGNSEEEEFEALDRLGFNNCDESSGSNNMPKVEYAERIISRKQKTIEEPSLDDATAPKRLRRSLGNSREERTIAGKGGWLAEKSEHNTREKRTMAGKGGWLAENTVTMERNHLIQKGETELEGTNLSATSAEIEQAPITSSFAAASLSTLLNSKCVNPTMLLHKLIEIHKRIAEFKKGEIEVEGTNLTATSAEIEQAPVTSSFVAAPLSALLNPTMLLDQLLERHKRLAEFKKDNS